MKRFSEQLHNKAQTIKLETAERRELRERVVSYMEYHPLPQSAKQVSPRAIPSPLSLENYRTVRISLPMLLKWSAAVSAVVLIIVPVLAEKSVPGDSLYAIKVRFNEEVRATLTLSPYEKVEWETERLNRRISEAKLLASEGRLTEEVGAEMAAAVREHTENVQHEIEVLRQSDADNATLASIELNTTLTMQSDSLQGEGTTIAMMAMAKTEADDSSTQLLADVINESLSKQGANMASSSLPAYEKVMARVEINTTRAYELLNSLDAESDSVLRSDVDRRLQDVNRSIEKANNARSANEAAASQSLVEALQRTQKLIVFLTDIEVGKSTNLESIVPTIPTPEEEQQLIKQFNEEIDRSVKILTELRPEMSAGVMDKVDFALETVVEKRATMSSETDFARTKALAEETLELLNDSLRIVEADGVVIYGEPVAEPVLETPVATTSEDGGPEMPVQ